MTGLSPNYRNDTPNGIPKDIKDYLDEHFLKSVRNIHHQNPRLLVVFSGGNGLGKSTLAQKIGNELHGLILENDDIKSHLITLNPQLTRDERNVLTWQYSMDLYQRLSSVTPNGLVVRDGVIDWYYDRILPVFEKQQYQLFVVGYDVSRERCIELIKKRGDKPTVSQERLLELLDDHKIHAARFRKLHKPDIILTDDNLFDHETVLAAIRRRLDKLLLAESHEENYVNNTR